LGSIFKTECDVDCTYIIKKLMSSWATFGASSIDQVLTMLACSIRRVDDQLLFQITLLDCKRSMGLASHSMLPQWFYYSVACCDIFQEIWMNGGRLQLCILEARQNPGYQLSRSCRVCSPAGPITKGRGSGKGIKTQAWWCVRSFRCLVSCWDRGDTAGLWKDASVGAEICFSNKIYSDCWNAASCKVQADWLDGFGG